MKKNNPDPQLLERIACLETDVSWLKQMVSVELLLLVGTLIGILVQLAR